MLSTRRARLVTSVLIAAVVAGSCSSDAPDTAPSGPAPATAPDTAPSDTAPDAAPDTGPDDASPDTTTAPLAEVDVALRPGVEQLALTGETPGAEVALVAADAVGQPIATGTVDTAGSLLFRGLEGGEDYRVVVDGAGVSAAATVLDRDATPVPSLYSGQDLQPGFGYIETRDGTTLSANVVLPGDPADGPYPTVVEYSGYSPSDPDATGFKDLFTALGYAYVGVNMRGTGCSGGSFRFFEYAQSLDGYDVIETVAAQPWAANDAVGMVGVSYPGISQLFVAQTRPPSLAAITPFSVIDDSYRSTLYPGGLLNTGFAVEWTQDRLDESAPEGQGWAAARIADGDEICAANQELRLQNPDLVAEIGDNEFYDPALGDELAPQTFVDRIEVPTFIAGAWQDEQTGGRFPTMLDRFTGTDRLYASLVNGLHTESIGAGVFPRYVEFLDLYVGRRTPSLGAARVIAPILAGGIFGTSEVELPPDRFEGMSYDDALAAFEADPPVQILFEEGAADGAVPLAPLPRFVHGFESWPIPTTEPTAWYLSTSGDGLAAAPPADNSRVQYVATPDSVPATFWNGDGNIWGVDVEWQWQEPPPDTAASFVSAPLAETLVMAGSGSADLWVSADSGDTDLEVTLSEVRPDGQEVYVQSGWLRASHRALDDAESTELRPVHTHLAVDAEPLPDGVADTGFALARVEIFPFAHVFRAGSRIRIAVDAPGGNRAEWEFDTIADGELVQIAVGGDFPSRVVLPVVPDVEVPAAAPACESLRGQPCRPFAG